MLSGRNDIQVDLEVNSTANGGGNRVSYTKKVLGLVSVTVDITNKSYSPSLCLRSMSGHKELPALRGKLPLKQEVFLSYSSKVRGDSYLSYKMS
ncbi:hypothetical protein ACFSKU_10260 [Pontibacter silvestris]|uniref:Uncharacterized protein n=1 Tax=Pontibacter silvestris TaxID=2305183 RepID=A0ABW4WYI6_9BACT|nr:hypothetical protein [Pontibacter silvestris]MCC9136779.1 hypothetical protein [Pontibacter silvestris]